MLLNLFFVLFLFDSATLSYSFRWHVVEKLETNKYFTFSERYMFASGKGPTLLEQGVAFINIDLNVETM